MLTERSKLGSEWLALGDITSRDKTKVHLRSGEEEGMEMVRGSSRGANKAPANGTAGNVGGAARRAEAFPVDADNAAKKRH